MADHSAGRTTLRAVNEDGTIRLTEDRAQPQLLNDVYLRSIFPRAGSPTRPGSTETPDDQLRDAAARMGGAIRTLGEAMSAIRSVKAADGNDHVETVGVDRNHVKEWKKVLDDATSDLEYWGRIWQRRNRSAGGAGRGDDWDVEYHEDPDQAVGDWEDEDAGGRRGSRPVRAQRHDGLGHLRLPPRPGVGCARVPPGDASGLRGDLRALLTQGSRDVTGIGD